MILSADTIISILFPAIFLYIGYHLLFSLRKVRSEGFPNSNGSQPKKKLSNDAMQLKNNLFSAILIQRSNSTSTSNGDFASPNLTLSIRMDWMATQRAEDFDGIVSVLEELFDVFIIAYADSAEQMEQYTMELTGSPFLASFRNKHRILFYQSSVAKAAFLRNIDPLVHLEYDEDFAKTMLKHVPMVLRYDALPAPAGKPTGGWSVSEEDGRMYAEIRSLPEILQLDKNPKRK